MESIERIVYRGDGYGYGSSSGDGYGSGSGYGYGYGSGSGYGDGITDYNKIKIYKIDGIQTLIKRVRGNLAVGYTLNKDLTLTPCVIVRKGDIFAHGKDTKQARESLLEKMFEELSEDERIAMFLSEVQINKKYKARYFYNWHGKLTGSCEFGRERFVQNNEIDLDKDEFNLLEFVEICKGSYGYEIIKNLKGEDS